MERMKKGDTESVTLEVKMYGSIWIREVKARNNS